MSRKLTPQSTLENLKREAKRWLRALREHDDAARARLDRALPGAPASPGLRDVQHALAREHGLAGWSELRTRLGDAAAATGAEPGPLGRVAWFIHNACPDHHVRGAPAHVRAWHTALRLLRRHPELARDSFYTAIVCGDLDAVERELAERPGAATLGGGPKGWEPLLYLCFTRLGTPAAIDNAVAIARTLLDQGADANAYFMAGGSRYTPLVGAIGEGEEDRPRHPQRDALVRLLLERGAEPYDIQVLYNTHFHGDQRWFLELMHEHSVRAGREADWRDPEWSMLDMGGYGSGSRYLLDVAVKHDDLALAEWILSHGASPNVAPPRDPRMSKCSLYEDALRSGSTQMAELLLRFGATPSTLQPDGEDAFVAACLRLDREMAETLAVRYPDYLRSPTAMFAAAERDRADVVELLLALGMSPDVQDATGQRGLHVAAYGNAEHVVALLVARGADVNARETSWGNTPLGAAVYAQAHRAIELLAPVSGDLWELGYIGEVERLRAVLREHPEHARAVADGETPLMWLPDDEGRAMEVARLLLEHGADPSIRNTQGRTAADVAERRALFEVAELLRDSIS